MPDSRDSTALTLQDGSKLDQVHGFRPDQTEVRFGSVLDLCSPFKRLLLKCLTISERRADSSITDAVGKLAPIVGFKVKGHITIQLI